jgi:hypothetical protein
MSRSAERSLIPAPCGSSCKLEVLECHLEMSEKVSVGKELDIESAGVSGRESSCTGGRKVPSDVSVSASE